MLLFLQNASVVGATGLGAGVGGGEATPTVYVSGLGAGQGGGDAHVAPTDATVVLRNVDRPIFLAAA